MPDWIQAVDSAILLFFQEVLRLELLNPLVVFYTHLGDAGLMWIVLSLVMLFFPKTRRAGILALCAMALGLVCNNWMLKHLVQRSRPYLVVTGLVPLVPPPDPNSFPSGHTCAAFASAITWLRTLPQRWMKGTGVALAVLMGLSRLYVGVHFPSDVLVGGLVGSLCACLVYALARYLGQHRGQAL